MMKLCVQRAFLLRPIAVKQLLAARPPPVTPGAVGGGGVTGVLSHHVPGCWYGTHGRKEPKETLNNPKSAKEFIYRLKPNERTCLLKELQTFESVAIAQETVAASPPTSQQIRYVLIHNCLPFIGFGFLDNAIMIAAGTQIELSIGVTLGISTMAAAAWGNLVSDLAGLGLAGYVEALVSRLGMAAAELSPKQADMWQTRLSAHMGKAIGVTIGCILGMFPLLFMNDHEDDKPTEPTAATPSNS